MVSVMDTRRRGKANQAALTELGTACCCLLHHRSSIEQAGL